ncbi:alpha amylase family protein [Marinilabiliaceae bacterium ANBcel2]|nr:alpha amylase family protein [Marinilabiliaceae bacterium ANBcel2]
MKGRKLISRVALFLSVVFITSCDKYEKVDESKEMFMWFDVEANFERLSYPDSIAYYLDKVKEAGFTDVVLDIKSITGEVTYQSDYAPYMKDWHGVERDVKYDLPRIFIDESKKRDLKVHASLNIFSGAHNFYERGIIYTDEYAHWQSQNYWEGEIIPISEMHWNYNGMLNPALPEAQQYQLAILQEVATKYSDFDGILLDRGRYDGITSDFSLESKKMFEEYSGITVNDFPDDILYWEESNDEYEWKRGQYFNKWIEWRAMVIHDFFRDARETIKNVNPDIGFGAYTGAWYPVYYELGVNWASKNYDPSQYYDWATEDYKNSGYAEMLDIYLSGLYFFEVTIAEVEAMNQEAMRTRGEAAMGEGRDYWYSVEGSAQLAKEVTKGVVPLTGTLYVDQYQQDSEQFERAVAMALRESDGLGIFDIVHIIDKDWWDVLKRGIDKGLE